MGYSRPREIQVADHDILQVVAGDDDLLRSYQGKDIRICPKMDFGSQSELRRECGYDVNRYQMRLGRGASRNERGSSSASRRKRDVVF